MSLRSKSKSSSVLLASMLSQVITANDQNMSMAEQVTEMPADLLRSAVLELLQRDHDYVENDIEEFSAANEGKHNSIPTHNGLMDNTLDNALKKKKKKKKVKDPDPIDKKEEEKVKNTEESDNQTGELQKKMEE